jgi:hypothetical protein
MVFVEEEHNGEWELQSIDSFENTVSGHRFTACVYLNSNGFLSKHQTKAVIYRTDYLTGTKKILFSQITISTIDDPVEYIKINGIQQANSNIWVTKKVGLATFINIYNENGIEIFSGTHDTSVGFWFDTVVEGTTLYYVGQKSTSPTDLRASRINQDGSSFFKSNFSITGQIDATIQSNVAIAVKGDNLYVCYCDNVAERLRIKAISKVNFSDAIADTSLSNIGVPINKVVMKNSGSGASDPLLIVYNGLTTIYPLTTPTTFGNVLNSQIFIRTVDPTTFASSILRSTPESGSIASKIFTVPGLSNFFIISDDIK